MNNKQIILEFLHKSPEEQRKFLYDTNIECVSVKIRKDSNYRREQKKRAAIKRKNDPRHTDRNMTLSQFNINTNSGKVSTIKGLTPKRTLQGYLNIVILGKTYSIQRLIMMKHLGRFLTKSEQVHHRNMKHDDNRLANLRLVSPDENIRHWKLVSIGEVHKAKQLDDLNA